MTKILRKTVRLPELHFSLTCDEEQYRMNLCEFRCTTYFDGEEFHTAGSVGLNYNDYPIEMYQRLVQDVIHQTLEHMLDKGVIEPPFNDTELLHSINRLRRGRNDSYTGSTEGSR